MQPAPESWIHRHRAPLSIGALALVGVAGAGGLHLATSYADAQLAASMVAAERLRSLNEQRAAAATGSHIRQESKSQELESLILPPASLTRTSVRSLAAIDSSQFGQAAVQSTNEHSYFVDGIMQPLTDDARITPELLAAVREQLKKELPIDISDEALKRGLLRTSSIIAGAAKDLGLNERNPLIEQTIARTFIDYKWAEAFLEARAAFGVRSLAELENLEAAQWAQLSSLIDKRGPIEKAQLGTATFSEFAGYIQQQLLNPGQANGLSWR